MNKDNKIFVYALISVFAISIIANIYFIFNTEPNIDNETGAGEYNEAIKTNDSNQNMVDNIKNITKTFYEEQLSEILKSKSVESWMPTRTEEIQNMMNAYPADMGWGLHFIETQDEQGNTIGITYLGFNVCSYKNRVFEGCYSGHYKGDYEDLTRIIVFSKVSSDQEAIQKIREIALNPSHAFSLGLNPMDVKYCDVKEYYGKYIIAPAEGSPYDAYIQKVFEISEMADPFWHEPVCGFYGSATWIGGFKVVDGYLIFVYVGQAYEFDMNSISIFPLK